MRFSDYIATTQVFTTESLLSAVGKTASVRVSLSRASSEKKVSKVRNGLYVSKTGKFTGELADPYLIAQTFKPNAVFTYHSALDLHGIAHSFSNRVQFTVTSRPLSFVYEGVWFIGYIRADDLETQSVASHSFGTVTVTTREQTFVDCLTNVSRAGGAEEVVRSLNGLLYVDVGLICAKVKSLSVAAISRIGWLLEMNRERWEVSSGQLEMLINLIPLTASSHLDPDIKNSAAYNARWRLNLPATEKEISTWMA
ncbi:MAG: hypothetical protein FWD43_06010 [Coriobacteriia bacterium]|nr:hypothetical protein [Coriobacteriia bacterium]